MNKTKLKDALHKDRKAFGGVDPVEAVLFLTSKYTLLPELFDIFGKEAVVEFLTRFGGKTIKIPSMEVLQEALTQLIIWSSLTSDSTEKSVKKLSLKHGMKESELRAAHTRVQGMVNEHDKRFSTEGSKEIKEGFSATSSNNGEHAAADSSTGGATSYDTSALYGLDDTKQDSERTGGSVGV